MNVKDDVMDSSAPARRTRTGTVLAALLGVVLALSAAATFPPAALPLFEARLPWSSPEMPAPARAGVATTSLERSADASRLVVRSARASVARELAEPLAAREASGAGSVLAAQRGLEAVWRDRVPAGPLPAFAPAALCAARLRADAAVRRDLVRGLPSPYAGSASISAASAPVELRARADDVRRAAEALDPGALSAALDRLGALDAEWIASGVPSREAPSGERGAFWRRLQIERALAHDALAEAVEAALTPDEAASVPMAAAASQPERGHAASAAFAALVRSGPGTVPVEVRPVARTWALWLGAASLAGLAAGWLAALLVRPRPRRVHAPLAIERGPGEPGAWLHLVTGPSTKAIARGVFEVAAHGLARHERVLVIDASPRLALHELFEREPRWGLMECLTAEMPILGLVQYGGRPGLYLLAHGRPARGDGWSRLGQCLDDIRPHFGRVVVALDVAAPRVVGEALLGRAFEAWWAEAVHRLPRAGVDWVSRMGIALSGMDLSGMPEATLECLRSRASSLEPAAVEPAWERVLEASTPPVPTSGLPAPQPVVLDCDLQVRERLRFLAWMRRVEKESRRRAEAEAIPQG